MRRARAALPEGAFAVVMATAVVARATHAELPEVSTALLWTSLAALVLVAAVLMAAPLGRGAAWWWHGATFAAAAAALGAAAAAQGQATAGLVLAGACLAGWVWLVAQPAPWRADPEPPAAASGRRLLAVVATQSAVIAATALIRSEHATAADGAALAVWAAAIAAYAAMIAPVARGMTTRARAGSFRPDDWIAMGALAISALAAAALLRMPGVPLRPAVRVVGIAAWSGAWLWVPTLVRLDVTAALRRGRGLPGAGRWNMVFPIGMLCAASQALGTAAALPAFVRLGRDTAWVALAAWTVVAAGRLAAAGARGLAAASQRRGHRPVGRGQVPE
jgi:Voltage-dependent anion channel